MNAKVANRQNLSTGRIRQNPVYLFEFHYNLEVQGVNNRCYFWDVSIIRIKTEVK